MTDMCTGSIDVLQAQLETVYGPYTVERSGPRSSGRLWMEPDVSVPIGALKMRDVTVKRSSKDRIWHGCHYLISQAQGEANISQSNSSFRMSGGDLMLANARDDFVMDVRGESMNFALHLPEAFFPSDVEHLFGKQISGNTSHGSLLNAMATAGIQAARLKDSETVLALCRLIADAVTRYAENFTSKARVPLVIESLEPWVIERLADPDLSPRRLADQVRMSERQLYRLFSQHGLTPAGWIWELRLNRAHDLVRSVQTMSMTDVAFATGFSDSAHFSKLFRKRFGQSPRCLRQGGNHAQDETDKKMSY